MKKWEEEKRNVDIANKKIDNKYDKDIEKSKKDLIDWENERKSFDRNQEEFNLKIDELKDSYMNKEVNAVTDYCRMVLDDSKYPESFPKDYELEFNPDNGNSYS